MNPDAIKYRINSLSKKKGVPAQKMWEKFFREQFLYLLSTTKYIHHFCLKGGALLELTYTSMNRSTKDIDFLGIGINSNVDEVTHIFQEICASQPENQLVLFNIDMTKPPEVLHHDGLYEGVRLYLFAKLKEANTQHTIKIEIGFGDVVTPHYQTIQVDTLIGITDFAMLSYTNETVIAEKFYAMITLADKNSRMKDFYDVYFLLKDNLYSESTLNHAILNTFKNRQFVYLTTPYIFGNEITTNNVFLERWASFLAKNALPPAPSFGTVVTFIVKQLSPIYQSLEHKL
ncbi:MAG: nucleotidyl transferase AbiEii/AbiGii toxin family protein [Bacteroidia bacterium]